MPPVYWDTLLHGEWTFHTSATNAGLCCVTLPNETFGALERWVAKHLPKAMLVQERTRLRPYIAEIEEYLSGQRNTFSVPLDLRGTAFQIQVWRALLEIPFGKTRNYAEVASAIGHPTAVRAVGAANGANPIPIIVPCHRVVGKDGALTGYRGGVEMKERLLALEGVRCNT